MVAFANSRILGAITLLITIFSLSLPAYAQYSGGTGEPNNPYQIATAEDLMLLGETPDDYDKHLIMTADIDLDTNLPGRKVFDKAVIAPDVNDTETDFQGTTFTGVFDGNGHIISNLTIEGVSFLGLFGQLGSEAIVTNLGVEAVDVNGTGGSGGLVGVNGNPNIGVGGTLTNCYSTGTIIGSGYIGGLVGSNFGRIMACYSAGIVVGGEDCIGGLVGYNNEGSIIVCNSTAAVTGDRFVGGLVGCHVSRDMVNCYSTGMVYGNENVGGLVGLSGSIDYSGSHMNPPFVPVLSPIIFNCFWDIQTSGQDKSDGGIGLITKEMQDIDTYLSAGWDFADEVINGTCDYWQMLPGNYPQLRYLNGESPVMLEGSGTAEQPYLIRDIHDLGALWFVPSAHYRLETSIDLSGITWSMSVVPWFKGTFDGNFHVISNLHIEGRTYLGLFGRLTSEAKILNIGLKALDVNGWYDVAGLVGNNQGGNITSCYTNGSVCGHYYVGGLVGSDFGNITMSCSTCSVSGNMLVGGLVGASYGSIITMSYSSGTVGGGSFLGGISGFNGIIANSYSTSTITGLYRVGGLMGGNVGNNSITNSFWDTEASDLINMCGYGIGGDDSYGKTTTEMQMASTFLDAGWDFVDETANGTEDIWWIIEGQDYPRLWWEAE